MLNPETAESLLFAEQRYERARKSMDAVICDPYATRHGIERAWAREQAAGESLRAIQGTVALRLVSLFGVTA